MRIAIACTLLSLLYVATAKAGTPKCDWFAYDPNIIFAGYCKAADDFTVAVQPEPSTYIGKALTRVFGRNLLCKQLRSAAACAAAAPKLGCSWDGVRGACTGGAELSSWRWFTTHTYFEEAPRWMQCPGSPLQVALRCTRLAFAGKNSSVCDAVPGCVYNAEQGGCSSAAQVGWSTARLSAWYDQARAWNPAVVGTCESICYARRVVSCSSPPGDAVVTPAKAAAWCAAQPYCKLQDGLCRANLYGADAWGKAVAAAGIACAPFSNSTACNAAAAGGGFAVRMERINKYLNYAGGDTVNCAA